MSRATRWKRDEPQPHQDLDAFAWLQRIETDAEFNAALNGNMFGTSKMQSYLGLLTMLCDEMARVVIRVDHKVQAQNYSRAVKAILNLSLGETHTEPGYQIKANLGPDLLASKLAHAEHVVVAGDVAAFVDTKMPQFMMSRPLINTRWAANGIKDSFSYMKEPPSGYIPFQDYFNNADDETKASLLRALDGSDMLLPLDNTATVRSSIMESAERVFKAMAPSRDTDKSLFAHMVYDEIAEDGDMEAYIMQKLLYSGDMYAETRERVMEYVTGSYIDVAVGQNNKTDEDPYSEAGAPFSRKKIADVLENVERSEESEEVMLYAKRRVSIDTLILAAYGMPQTYKEIAEFYSQQPANVTNRTTRFCWRLDSLLRVGVSPQVLIQASWDTPGEVVKQLVRKRIAKGSSLSSEDVKACLDEVELKR